MFTKIEHAKDENEQKDEAGFIFKPVSVEACRFGGGKALSTASFPQKHCKNPRQAVPMSIVSLGSQLISSISLSLCESRQGFAESNRNGRGAEEGSNRTQSKSCPGKLQNRENTSKGEI